MEDARLCPLCSFGDSRKTDTARLCRGEERGAEYERQGREDQETECQEEPRRMSRRMVGEHDAAPPAAKDSEVRRRGRIQQHTREPGVTIAADDEQRQQQLAPLFLAFLAAGWVASRLHGFHTEWRALSATLRRIAVLQCAYEIAPSPRWFGWFFCRKRPRAPQQKEVGTSLRR